MRILGILMALLMFVSNAVAENDVMLHAVNVGKADALILQCGTSTYLIDTGTEESWGALSCALKMHGITKLDGVIITHTDGDHGGGAWALAQSSVEIGTWYASKWYTRKEKNHPAIQAAALREQEVVWLKQGDSLPLDGGNITVLGPVYEAPDKENNNSVVLLVEAGGGRMLLTGDMEFPEEKNLLQLGLIPTCDVLKVGNHGESDATSQALVDAVQPKIAVISTNTEEEPDTPAPRVLRLLQDVLVYQTQDSAAGVVVTLSNGVAQAANVAYTDIPAVSGAVRIAEKGKDDSVRLRNDGEEPVDLTNWFIRSERGGEIFVFPSGAVLQSGEEVCVISQSSEGTGDYLWPDKKVWHKKKDDACILCDPYGREIDRMP